MLLHLQSLFHIRLSPADLTSVTLMPRCSLFSIRALEKQDSYWRLKGCDVWANGWGGPCWKAAVPSFAFPTLQREQECCFFRSALCHFFLHSPFIKQENPGVVTLTMAKCIFTYASDNIWAKPIAKPYEALSVRTWLWSQGNLMLPSRHPAIAEALQPKS